MTQRGGHQVQVDLIWLKERHDLNLALLDSRTCFLECFYVVTNTARENWNKNRREDRGTCVSTSIVIAIGSLERDFNAG